MEHMKLEVKKRDNSGTQVCRKIRKSGFVPAVVYGLEEEPMPVEVAFGDIESARRSGGEHAVIDLKIMSGENDERVVPVIVRDEQFHPVRGELMHVDFYRVNLNKEITSEVPLETFGEPAGLQFGGILEHSLRDLEVRCLPDKLPEKIELDVSALNIGDSLHVSDITAPEGVEILNELDMMVVSLIPPRMEEEPEAEEAVEEGAEPEVITEKKEAEETEEGDKEKKEKKEKE